MQQTPEAYLLPVLTAGIHLLLLLSLSEAMNCLSTNCSVIWKQLLLLLPFLRGNWQGIPVWHKSKYFSTKESHSLRAMNFMPNHFPPLPIPTVIVLCFVSLAVDYNLPLVVVGQVVPVRRRNRWECQVCLWCSLFLTNLEFVFPWAQQKSSNKVVPLLSI